MRAKVEKEACAVSVWVVEVLWKRVKTEDRYVGNFLHLLV